MQKKLRVKGEKWVQQDTDEISVQGVAKEETGKAKEYGKKEEGL